jgi:hypothetical protein
VARKDDDLVDVMPTLGDKCGFRSGSFEERAYYIMEYPVFHGSGLTGFIGCARLVTAHGSLYGQGPWM